MDKLYCKLDELAKLYCKFDELAKLRMIDKYNLSNCKLELGQLIEFDELDKLSNSSSRPM